MVFIVFFKDVTGLPDFENRTSVTARKTVHFLLLNNLSFVNNGVFSVRLHKVFYAKKTEKKRRNYSRKTAISTSFQSKSTDITMQKVRDYLAKALILPRNSIDIRM